MNVNIALLTVTDTRTLKTDKSGNILVDKISKANHNLIDRKICKDSKKTIKKILKDWTKKKKIDVIITTGGTGLTGRDITPEATKNVLDKEIPGISEAMRIETLKYKWPRSLLKEIIDNYRDIPEERLPEDYNTDFGKQLRKRDLSRFKKDRRWN